MNFEDFDINSLTKQKIPFPVITSILLDDKDKISANINWSFFEPLEGGKGIFDSYKSVLTTTVHFFTDTSVAENILSVAPDLKKQGAFIESTKPLKTVFGSDAISLSTSLPFSTDFVKPFQTEGIEFNRYDYGVSLPNLTDRLTDLYGLIEVIADFSNAPFGSFKGQISYSLPFTIAKGGIVNFTFQALQTENQEIWAGPFKVNTDPTVQIVKQPLDTESPNLSLVTVTDPNVVSNFVGTTKSDAFQLDFNQGDFYTIDQQGNAINAKTFGEAQKFASASPTRYFDDLKLEKLESPLGELFYWDCLETNSVNLAFEFNLTKFLNSSAFNFQNTNNVYQGQIKSFTLTRKRISNNIDDNKTEDFPEEEIFTSKFLGQNLPNDLFGSPDEEDLTISVFNVSTENTLKSLFVVKDKKFNKAYTYEYGIKLTYESKVFGDLINFFHEATAKLQKFSALENVITLSRYYDDDLNKMTDAFFNEYAVMIDQTKKAFLNLYFNILQVSGANPQQKGVFADILSKINPITILPSTFFVLKDALASSLEQIKSFSLAPDLSLEPKQNDSKKGTVATKSYKLAKTVSLKPPSAEDYKSDKLVIDYFNRSKSKSYDPILVLDQDQLNELFIFEYAKYFGTTPQEDAFFTGFTPQGLNNYILKFSPLLMSNDKVTVPFTSPANFFVTSTKNSMTSLSLSVSTGKSTGYQESGGNSRLLQGLLASGVSIVNSTNEPIFTTSDDFSNKSFNQYFADGIFSLNKERFPKEAITQYQDLEDVTSVYKLIETVGQEKVNNFIKALKELVSISTKGLDLKSSFPNLPQPHNFLGTSGTTQQDSSDFMFSLKAAIAGDRPLDQLEITTALLVFTNIASIEYYDNDSWKPLTFGFLSQAQPKQGYFLCRLGLSKEYAQEETNFFPFSMINNQYFLYSVADVQNTLSFELPVKSAKDLTADDVIAKYAMPKTIVNDINDVIVASNPTQPIFSQGIQTEIAAFTDPIIQPGVNVFPTPTGPSQTDLSSPQGVGTPQPGAAFAPEGVDVAFAQQIGGGGLGGFAGGIAAPGGDDTGGQQTAGTFGSLPGIGGGSTAPTAPTPAPGSGQGGVGTPTTTPLGGTFGDDTPVAEGQSQQSNVVDTLGATKTVGDIASSVANLNITDFNF
jgi:hypothetical protein